MIWSAKTLGEALNINIDYEISCGPVQFNSQNIQKGDLFIAIKGNGDGHDYVIDALDRGASIVIISRDIKDVPSNKKIIVDDTFLALQQMAEYKRNISKAKFIAITGSVGKTSTKEATKVVLSSFGKTFASRGNFNNYLGVPLNLASMPDDIEYAIIELGMNHEGEIRSLTKIVKPDIAVITWVSEAHLEYFNSVQDIADAKSEIFEGLQKGGIAIINIDNKYYGRIMFNLERLNIPNKSIYTFGKREGADSRLKLYENLGAKVHLVFEVKTKAIDLQLPFIAEHYVRNYASVLMVASVLNLDLIKASSQLDKVELMDGRGKIINAVLGEKKYQIICDYYNANPASFTASLEYFKQIKNPRKVAIIGDMLELGETAPILHKNLVPLIIDSGAKKVFLVGTNVRHIHESLPENIHSIHFLNVDSLLSELDSLIEDDELILIKGSRRMALDKVVKHFTVA